MTDITYGNCDKPLYCQRILIVRDIMYYRLSIPNPEIQKDPKSKTLSTDMIPHIENFHTLKLYFMHKIILKCCMKLLLDYVYKVYIVNFVFKTWVPTS